MTYFQKFVSQDIDLLNRMIQMHPEFQETATIVKQILGSSKFPINSFDDLAESVAPLGSSLTFRGRPMSIDQVRKLVPSYYFPISSEADLFAKISELQKVSYPVTSAPAVQQQSGVDINWAAPLRALPAGTPAHPSLSADQIFTAAEGSDQSTGVGKAA